MKSFTGKFTSARGWVLMIALFFGAGLMISACGDEEVPAPTTPAPPPPAPEPEPEPTPEPPTTPVGLMVSGSTESSITWTWNAVEGATGYVVQASTDEMFDDMVLGNPETVLFNGVPFTPMTSYTATDLDAETSLYVRVAAAAGTVDAPLVSAFSTHVTGMATAAASAAPAAPMNVRATAQRSTYIEWSWDAVSGAAGYHAQFSRSTDFSDPAADRPLLQRTSVRISNLPAETDGYLRVRAYTGSGTGEDTVFGDWSATSMSSTGEPPPPPAPTALDAPGNVQTSIAQNSITVTWGAVDDAVEYAVEQQRAAGGSWGDASCGTGGTVTATSCVASGLDQATAYNFRVKAFPDSSDTTLTESSWSSAVSATTSGVAPPPPITGGDDDLNITWDSDATSITWFWDAASDNRITNLYAVLVPGTDASPLRPPCPALGNDAWQSDKPYAIAHKLTGLTEGGGDVRGLCVRRTWEDDQDNVQYGPVSVLWAATSPKAPATADLQLGATEIQPGEKDDPRTRKTNAIDWFVEMDKGFSYEVRTVSATIADPSELGTCADDGTGNTNLSANTDGAHERFRLSTLSTYTEYKACVRAVDPNRRGRSEWTELGTYQTLPAAPGSVSGSPNVETGAANVTGTIAWSFGSSSRLPEQPDGYQAFVYNNSPSALTAAQGGTDPVVKLTVDTCDGTDPAISVQETGSGFSFSQTGLSFTRATATEKDYTVTVLACVRAKLENAQRTGSATPDGPWRIGTRTVSVKNLDPQ